LVATAINDIKLARDAITRGADVNAHGVTSGTGSLPLLRAIFYSSAEMVELLLSNGARAGAEEVETATLFGRAELVPLLKR